MRFLALATALVLVVLSGCSKNATAPPVATQVAFTSQPASTTVAAAVLPPIQVEVRDASGTRVTTGTSIITMALGSTGAVLGGTTTRSTVSGVASFTDLSIAKVGGYALVASSGTLTSATSNGFTVMVGPVSAAQATLTAARDTITASGCAGLNCAAPAHATTGVSLTTFTVTALDAGANAIGGAAVTVSATGTGNTVGQPAPTNANGVTTGTLTSTGAGAKTITAVVNGVTLTQTASLTVTPGTTSQLAITGQPTTTVEGRPISPPVVVTAEDAFGNPTPSFVGSVSLTLGANALSASLFGATMVPATNGVATFPILMVATGSTPLQGTVAGSGYVLTASSGALTPGTSAAFSIGTTGIYYWAPVPLMPGYIEACYFLTGAACGPIITTPKVAAIYWSGRVIYSGGPAPGTQGAGAQDGSLIGFFLRNLAGSPYYATTTTYYDVSNASLQSAVTSVQNDATYTQFWADSTAAADTAPTDSAIQTEVARGIASGALAYDSHTMYAVFSGPGVNLGGGFAPESSGYCGYHFHFLDALGRNVNYAVLPHDYDLHNDLYRCDDLAVYGSPNAPDSAADAEVDVLAHEFAETITDENGNAWFDDSGNEIGDLCNFTFSSFTLLGGKTFLVQRLWVNAETSQGSPVGCVQNLAGDNLAGGAVRAREVALVGYPRTTARLHATREVGRHTMLKRGR